MRLKAMQCISIAISIKRLGNCIAVYIPVEFVYELSYLTLLRGHFLNDRLSHRDSNSGTRDLNAVIVVKAQR